MTHTTKSPPNRRAAADAARKLLAPGIQQKVDLVSELADAVLAASAAQDAYQAAEQHPQACRTAYAERCRAALNGGWSDAELTQLDVFPAGSRRNGEEEAGEAGQGLIGCGHGYGWCTTSAMRASVAHWSGHPTPPGRRPAGPAARRVGRG